MSNKFHIRLEELGCALLKQRILDYGGTEGAYEMLIEICQENSIGINEGDLWAFVESVLNKGATKGGCDDT